MLLRGRLQRQSAVALLLVTYWGAPVLAGLSDISPVVPPTATGVPRRTEDKRVMLWQYTVNSTQADLAEKIEFHKASRSFVNAVSPTTWVLDLETLSLAQQPLAGKGLFASQEAFAQRLKTEAGVLVVPTLYDDLSHVGGLLPRLRELFKPENARKFISELVGRVRDLKLDGVNIDFEPRWQATADDAANYAKFVDDLSKAMHEEISGSIVSVDVGPCSAQQYGWQNNCAIFNMNEFNKTEVDIVCNMNTYESTPNMAQFVRETARNVDELARPKIGLGMLTYYKDWTEAELRTLFGIIEELGLREIDIWCCGIPELWIPYLKTFLGTSDR